jgi:hypothetical protein
MKFLVAQEPYCPGVVIFESDRIVSLAIFAEPAASAAMGSKISQSSFFGSRVHLVALQRVGT